MSLEKIFTFFSADPTTTDSIPASDFCLGLKKLNSEDFQLTDVRVQGGVWLARASPSRWLALVLRILLKPSCYAFPG